LLLRVGDAENASRIEHADILPILLPLRIYHEVSAL